jgi:hypothetical protein
MANIDTTQLDALVADLKAKEQALADASEKNDADQASALSAATVAAKSLSDKNSAHDALAGSVKALEAFVDGLVAAPAPVAVPAA